MEYGYTETTSYTLRWQYTSRWTLVGNRAKNGRSLRKKKRTLDIKSGNVNVRLRSPDNACGRGNPFR